MAVVYVWLNIVTVRILYAFEYVKEPIEINKFWIYCDHELDLSWMVDANRGKLSPNFVSMPLSSGIAAR